MFQQTKPSNPRAAIPPIRAARALVTLVFWLALVAVATACAPYDIDSHASAAWTATAQAAPPTGTPVPTAVPPTRTPRPTATPRPTSTPRALSTATPLQSQSGLDAIFAKVSELRGLQPRTGVPVGYLTPTELQQYLTASLEKENARGQVEVDAAILALLDLVDEDDDLYQLYLDAMTEQVAGFYDFETREMKLISRPGSPAPLDEILLVHEYVHALQDQHFDVGRKMEEVKEDSERTIALLSLLEGDATLFMGLYAQLNFTPDQLVQLSSQTPGGPSTEKLKAAPPVLEWQMLFPYLRGMLFVATAFQSGGMPAIDGLYANPPVDASQIMHPERYARGDVASAVRPLDLLPSLGSGWTVVTEDVMGEFGFWSYLRGGLSEAEAEAGASGWNGDRLALLRDQGGRYALVVLSSWVTPAEARDFYQRLHRLRASRPGALVTELDNNRMEWSEPSRSGYASAVGDQVLLVIGPDAATVDQVAGATTR